MPPERIVMESDIKKMTDDWLVEVMLGTIKYPLELRKQCEREFDSCLLYTSDAADE